MNPMDWCLRLCIINLQSITMITTSTHLSVFNGKQGIALYVSVESQVSLVKKKTNKKHYILNKVKQDNHIDSMYFLQLFLSSSLSA